MKIQKISMYLGLGIELCGIILAIICVFAQTQIPIIAPIMVWLGIITTMVSSFFVRRNLNITSDDKAVIDKKMLASVIILIILTVLVTIVSLVVK